MLSNRKGGYFNKLFYISLILFLYSISILVFALINTDFAEWYCRGISSFFRWVFSFLTGFVSFSVIEIFLFLFPFLVFYIVYKVIKCIDKGVFAWKYFFKATLIIVFIASFVFINNFAVCYFRRPVEENLNVNKKPLSREELYKATDFLNNELEASLNSIEFSKDGSSVNPHSWSQMDKLIDNGYKKLYQKDKFVSMIHSMPKKIILSPIMTYTHISGVYMPFTGEANINTNYPDYVVAYTVAHEKAHQRGIANEDEANFVAFLAMLESGDEYLRYSALMNMYDYFLDSAYKYDKELYYHFMDNTNDTIKGEMYSYYTFFKKYSDSKASEVADAVNDSYLKSMGDKDGVESYGKVVELFAAYISKNKGLPG